MKKRFGRMVFLCLLAVLFIITAAAQEPETVGELQTVEYTGTVDLFQCGSLTGNYTKPGDVSLFDDNIEEQIYDQLLEGLQAQQVSITLTRTDLPISETNLDSFCKLTIEIYETVVNDHPRLFYVRDGYNVRGEGDSSGLRVILQPVYWATITDAQIAAFDEAVETAKAQAAGVTDPLEITLLLHDYLVLQNAYDWDVATAGATDDGLVYTAYAALVQGNPVCQGYALAYKLLLDELGIECVSVISDSMNHMWNMVKIGEDWYHVDVTWDDPTPDTEGRCCHTYFLLSDEKISTLPSKHYDWDGALPECTSTNYESGWIFNESLSSVYRWRGSFYYVDRGYQLYEVGSLNEIAQTGYSISGAYHTGYGFAWADDGLYFVPYTTDTQHTLMACNLDTYTIEAVGTFDFTATAVPEYAAGHDFIGLRVNSAENKLEVVSSTRRQVLYTIQLPEKETGITHVTADPGNHCVRVNFRLTAAQPGSLVCAVYDASGKQLGVHCLNQPASGEYSVDVGCNVGDAETVKIFLLDENSSPLLRETVISVGT